jgi:hypothetical protein
MDDCKSTLENMEKLLAPVGKGKGGLLSRVRSQVKLELKSDEISLLKQQITAYRQTMHLSLQLITMQVILRNCSLIRRSSVLAGTEAFALGFDSMRLEIHRLSQQLRRYRIAGASPENTRIMQHLEVCVQSAGTVVSSASTMISSQTTIVEGSIFGPELSEFQRRRIEEWSTSSSPLSPNQPFPDPETGRYRNAEAVITSVCTDVTSSHDIGDPEIEIRLLQHRRESARKDLADGKYEMAETQLKRILGGSVAAYGSTRFEGHCEVSEMLATALCRQSKWDEAESILVKLWENAATPTVYDLSSLKAAYALANLFFGKQDWKNAAQWCQKAIGGVKSTLGMKSSFFNESVYLFTQILEAQKNYEEANAYMGLLPEGYACTRSSLDNQNNRAVSLEESRDIEILCCLKPDEAAKKIGSQFLRNVLPRDNGEGKVKQNWDPIRKSIRKNGNGVVGSSLILALACTGRELSLRTLLEKGADIESFSDHDFGFGNVFGTPLILAADFGREAVIQLLLEKGANPNATIRHQQVTSLIRAAMRGHVEIVRLLIEGGANMNAKEQFGHTALMTAVMLGRLEVVELLVSKGAEIWLANIYGHTALNLAEQSEDRNQAHKKIVAFLKSKMTLQPAFLAPQPQFLTTK